MKESSRHHYIPKFIIKGFTNEMGITYVYDKKIDKIWNKEISPKGILYEWDRNTIFKENDSNSIIEDQWYKYLDNDCAKLFDFLKNNENNEKIHHLDNVAKMQFFLIHLYWRLPKFDNQFNDLFEYSVKHSLNSEYDVFKNTKLKNIKNKLERIKLPNEIIKDTSKEKKTISLYSKLFEQSEDVLLLGDYPMLYKNEPSSLDEILYKDVFFPISSKRLYSISEKKGLNFSFTDITTLNALIINQSVRFICCPDRIFLEKSIEYYKKLKSHLSFDLLRKNLFDF